MPDDFEYWDLPTQHLGRRVHVHDCLDSTNTHALSLGNDPAQHGLVVVARQQTAGRGQYGRTWQAPPGSSVLLSVLLFPPIELRRPALLTAWAAVTVCETIRSLTDLHATIKWPNDVFLLGKKVSGILIEQRTTGNPEFPLASVVGIGLNVTQSADLFVQAGLPDAASLQSSAGRSLDYQVVATQLIQHLDGQYDRLLAGGVDDLESLWKDRLGLMGKRVIVEGVNEQTVGRLVDVTFAGVHLETAVGDVVRLAPERVRRIHRS